MNYDVKSRNIIFIKKHNEKNNIWKKIFDIQKAKKKKLLQKYK